MRIGVGSGGSLRHASTSRTALLRALEGAAEPAPRPAFSTFANSTCRCTTPTEDTPARERQPSSPTPMLFRQWPDLEQPLYRETISRQVEERRSTGCMCSDEATRAYRHDKVIGPPQRGGGTQGLQAINTMEFAVRALRGWAVPYVVPVASAAHKFEASGAIKDESVEARLQCWVPRLSASPSCSPRIARFTAA